jgi:predicted dehydrogenase
MLNVALIGIGHHAQWAVMPALDASPECRLEAVCDLREENLQAVKDPSVRRYTDFRRMLADGGFDCVYVATTVEYHPPLVIESLAAGYHVLCEKPLGRNAEECRQMVAAAEKADRRLAVGFENRYNADMRQVRRWIAEGRLGRVEAVHFQEFWDGHKTFGPYSARRAAFIDQSGCLDCGIHRLDLVRYLTGGGRWQNVHALGRWLGETERKHAVHIGILADLDSGVMATINASFAYAANIETIPRSYGLTIVGDRGVVNWASDGKESLTMTLSSADGVETFPYEELPHTQAIRNMMTDYARVLGGQMDWPEELATGTDGLIAQEILDESLRQTDPARPKV